MARLLVHRKAYRRRAYVRKDGVKVKATKVKASKFVIKDRGKPGRTPKAERWYKPKTDMGWRKAQSAATRRRLALKAHRGDKLATARALMALANVTTDPKTKRLAREDARYFYEYLI